MCGIAGLLAFDRPLPRQAPAMLGAMAEVMAHRGPDGHGVWLSDGRLCGLAHRRLAIVDLTETAGQPMVEPAGDLAVVFNGEIYNHRDLRRALQQQGCHFRTDHADTEVLLHGYATWGLDRLLEKLEGMFAFALWDGRASRLLLARDRLGKKPLYFVVQDGVLRFASEIKALLTDPALPRAIEPAAFHQYLAYLTVPAPLTLFRGIHKLPAGHLIEARPTGNWHARAYWRPLPGSAAAEPGEATATIRRLLADAVAKRLEADVPMGVLLSGGVNSTSVAALAARAGAGTLDSFTVGFRDHRTVDETAEAREAASLLGTRHHEVLIDASDALAMLDDLAFHQDEPLADWVCLPLMAVAKLAHGTGTKAVLVGEGADELFCGYPGYLSHLRFDDRYGSRLRRWPTALAGLPGHLAAGLSRVSRRADAMHEILLRAGRRQPIFWSGAVGFRDGDRRHVSAGRPRPADLAALPPGLAAVAEADPAAVAAALERQLLRTHPAAGLLDRITWAEFNLRLPELLLMRIDKMTMACGLEARAPFLDHRLVEYVLSLPAAARIPDRAAKALLKAAMRGIVPDKVIDRPKKGFGAPMAEWLREPFGKCMRSRLLDGPLASAGLVGRSGIERLFAEHASGRRDRSVQLWTLINASLWHERWLGGS